jgi:hypothetical protein
VSEGLGLDRTVRLRWGRVEGEIFKNTLISWLTGQKFAFVF